MHRGNSPDPPVQSLDPAEVLADPARHVHAALREPGFTMPARDALIVYEIDDPEQRDAIATRHRLQIALSPDARRNRLAIHRDLRAPRLKLSLQGTGSLCVLGDNACATGSITLRDRTMVIIAGSDRPRVLQVDLVFRGRDQKLFWGLGSTAEGVYTSVKADAVAIVVADDCMFSWRVWLRPDDMHLIVDLETELPVNPAEDIVIEPHVWVGQEALVLKGARIGAGSIIGAKALVPRGTYERMSIYGGNPARKLRGGVSWDREHEMSPEVMHRVRAIREAYDGPNTRDVVPRVVVKTISTRVRDALRAGARAVREKVSGE